MRTCQGEHRLIFYNNCWRSKTSTLFWTARLKLLAAKEHRPAYAEDGDYFSKPSVEDIFECVYEMMHENDPSIPFILISSGKNLDA